MEDAYIVDVMFRQLNLLFWDFRCYYMHNGGNSIPFDFEFFKLAKKLPIIYGNENVNARFGMFTFEDRELNRKLESKTTEEYAFKSIIMQFFFLRKEFLKVKRGHKSFDFAFYLYHLVNVGKSYGSINELEVIKREVIWSQSSDPSILAQGRSTYNLGNELETALKTIRSFRRLKKRGPDEFTQHLTALFQDFKIRNGRYPHNKEVERLLEQAVGQGFIHSVDEEIEWGENGRTKLTTLPNKLTEIRKSLTKKNHGLR